MSGILRPFVSAWMGESGKTFYLICWFPLLAVLWGGCFALSTYAYPGYQVTNHDISDLGDPAMNPRGWWFWSVGMGIAALMFYPPIAYASRRMEDLTLRESPGTRRLVAIGAMAMRSSCLGMAGLALVPQGPRLYDLIHMISGVFGFGGTYVTFLIFWSVPLFKAQEFSFARWMFFTLSAWWAVIGFLASQGYRFVAYGEVGHEYKNKGESVILRFSLWEWLLFAALTSSFVVLVALLPAKVGEEGANRDG